MPMSSLDMIKAGIHSACSLAESSSSIEAEYTAKWRELRTEYLLKNDDNEREFDDAADSPIFKKIDKHWEKLAKEAHMWMGSYDDRPPYRMSEQDYKKHSRAYRKVQRKYTKQRKEIGKWYKTELEVLKKEYGIRESLDSTRGTPQP